jgi:hypothetical protein
MRIILASDAETTAQVQPESARGNADTDREVAIGR